MTYITLRIRRAQPLHLTIEEIGSADLNFDPAAISVDDIAELIADEGHTAFR